MKRGDAARVIQRKVARPAFECDKAAAPHKAIQPEDALRHVLAVVALIKIMIELWRDIGPHQQQAAQG